MDINQTEQEKIEALQKWWAENSKSIISGIIIGLAAVFGWNSWQSYERSITEQASDLYTNMIVEMRDQKNDKAREYASKLINEYSRTTYADFAALMLARLDVEDARPDEAIKHLQQVLDDAGQESLKHLARLRLTRILLDQNKIDEAWAMLNVNDEGGFTASYAELKGDIYAREGKFDDARAAYQQVLGNVGEESSDSSFLQMKIDDLGRRNTK